jgi:hypothetical protein
VQVPAPARRLTLPAAALSELELPATIAFRNHSDNGNWKVDTALTSFQSGNGVTVLVKMWLFHHLIADLGQQAFYSFLVMTLFCAHLSGECMFVADFVVLVYRTVLDKKRA